MKDLITTNPETDEFAPIELGSVSAETRGILGVEEEFDGASNSQPL
ncbi:MAG: hypothetical protein ACK46Q_06605 [Hyphomonas sp.]